MKIEKVTFGATIPTTQYGNIQPSIELSDVTLEEADAIGLGFIKNLYSRFSTSGELKENTIQITSVEKKNPLTKTV